VRTSLIALLLFLAAPSLAFAQPKPAAPAKPGTQPAPATPAPPPPPPPEAPPPPGPIPLSESLTGDAKTDYESAKVLFGDGDNAGALVKFKTAYEKSKDPRLLWNVAACEKNLRHYSRALKLVRQYAAEGGDKLTDQDKSEAQDLIKVMDPLTAKLKLTVSEPGAEVFIDDEPVGTTPIDAVVVDIGSRKIRVKKDEFEEYVREVPVGGAAEVNLDVKLAKIVHEGRLNVRTSNDATISLDGKVVGTGTWSGILPSGGHSLSITAPKMRPYQSEVYLQDKESRDVNATLEQEPSKGLPTWAWIAGGAVLLGGATTAGFFIFRSEGKYEGPPGNFRPGIVQANTPIRF
jgi:hypothetical protein